MLPGLTFVLLYAWPLLEAHFTHDHTEHHLLDRPSDRPVRSAIGVGVLTFYLVLTAAGGQDIISQKLGLDIEVVRNSLRVLLFVLPLLVALLVWRFCRDLRASGVHTQREAETEPPIAPYEAPVGPDASDQPPDVPRSVLAPAPHPEPPAARRPSRSKQTLFALVATIAAIYAWLRGRRR